MFGVALVAGCFDAIAGGGGLLTVPALLLAGVDPVTALGTNKLQGSVGSSSATFAFARRGLIPWRSALPIALAAAVGSIAGASSVRLVPKEWLGAAVPLVLIAVALYFAAARSLQAGDREARVSPTVFALTAAPLVGFYDGVFGPGAGAFYTIGFITLLGFGVVKATGHTKLANAASNLASLALFAFGGSVLWTIGLVMAVGALIGGQIGARLAIRMGPKLIRPLLIVISCAMAVKLLSSPENVLHRAAVGWWYGAG